MAQAGPADCTAAGDDDEGDRAGSPHLDEGGSAGDHDATANCAAVFSGGQDDISGVQLWNTVMKKYKVAQICEEELAQLEAAKELTLAQEKSGERLRAVAEAVQALAKLHHRDTLKQLSDFANLEKEHTAELVVPHSNDFLSSRDPLFWFSCFVSLFPRGDCAERCAARLQHLPPKQWVKSLLTRADSSMWRCDVEFVACVYNIFLRREQINAVEAYIRSPSMTAEQVADLQALTAEGLLAAALTSGEVGSVRKLLQGSTTNLEKPVRAAFLHLRAIQRRVAGSESEKDNLLPMFTSLRLWSGCSSLFITLNPHDIRSPMTLLLLHGGETFHKEFSLDFSDEATEDYMRAFLRDDPRRLHRLVASDPLAATRCFHWTVRLTIRTLFNCVDKPGGSMDSIAAGEAPGIFGHVRAYLGVVEPQMRKALHLHTLVQLVGFAHPRDLFGSQILPDMLRRLWYFVASVSFRSTEGFANQLNLDSAMEKLAQLPLLPLTKKQRGMIGETRAGEAYAAQVRARGGKVVAGSGESAWKASHFTSTAHADRSVSADVWAQHAVSDVALMTRTSGNHVCRDDVCHKGHIGRKGFCRRLFWHWARAVGKDGKPIAKMTHGLQLQPRWDGMGSPPVARSPPSLGSPLVETNHPFHFKMNPALSLGPKCNHDVGVLLRLPSCPEGIDSQDAQSAPHGKAAAATASIASMLEAMGQHEFYCASYSSKEAPHMQGLTATLADGVRTKLRDIAAAREAGQAVTEHQAVKSILHRLVSSCNRCMHKGFPEMLSHLLGKPSFYCSHMFKHVSMVSLVQRCVAVTHSFLQGDSLDTTALVACDTVPLAATPKLRVLDYVFRPRQLEEFLLYFFMAGCAAAQGPGGRCMDWVEFARPSGALRQGSFRAKPKGSSSAPGLCLLDSARMPIHEYGYYVRLRTDSPWEVPLLHARFPRVPGDDSTPADRGFYALFLMLLFRPHRNLGDFLSAAISGADVSYDFADADDRWRAVYNEFCSWRGNIEGVAEATADGYAAGTVDMPVFNSSTWWACMIAERLRNYEAAFGKYPHDAFTTPSNVNVLPDFMTHIHVEPDTTAREEVHEASDSSSQAPADQDDVVGDEDVGPGHNPAPRQLAHGGIPASVLCGELPAGSSLDDFHYPPLLHRRRSVECNYWQGFAEAVGRLLPMSLPPDAPEAFPGPCPISVGGAHAAAAKQTHFFQSTDKLQATMAPPTSSRPGQLSVPEAGIAAAMDKFRGRCVPSPSVVMEAAFHLLEEKILDIPGIGITNVKQARALLWNAAWLQEHMTERWKEEGQLQLSKQEDRPGLFKDFCLAIMGPGGTGKTHVLKVIEALTIFFAGPDTVRKLAPSNAAARLLGGDTIHALCKLPYGQARLTSKKGRLAVDALRRHRATWNSAIAAYLDEISMVSGDQLLQCDVRMREGKCCKMRRFGGMAVNLCGDFLQLPPVDKTGTRKSLAVPVDDLGAWECEERGEHADTQSGPNVEGRQGFELWRSISRVVCLNVNVRALGALSRLLTEMRNGVISDEMWSLYQTRIVKPNDPRLHELRSKSVNGDVQFVVHRHRVRVMRALDQAKQYCLRTATPLFILQAADVSVNTQDKPLFSPEVRKSLLDRTNPDQTKGLPSFLPLHLGMRLILASKVCVRLGVMKGCVCELVHIVFAEGERSLLPDQFTPGEAHPLRYIPATLLLRAEGAEWTLAGEDLPQDLPSGMDRRGLFQLCASSEYLRVSVGDRYISVRRTTFAVMPAGTITVYAAQGSTFDTLVADMAKPPGMNPHVYWLACYVMLSRARSLDGLLVLRPASREELSGTPPQYLLDELQRLEEIEGNCLSELRAYIRKLPRVPHWILSLLDAKAPEREALKVSTVRRLQAVQSSTPGSASQMSSLGCASSQEDSHGPGVGVRLASASDDAARSMAPLGPKKRLFSKTAVHTFTPSAALPHSSVVATQETMVATLEAASSLPPSGLSANNVAMLQSMGVPQRSPSSSHAAAAGHDVGEHQALSTISQRQGTDAVEVLREWTSSAAEERATHASQVGIDNVDTVPCLQQDSALCAARGTDVLFGAARASELRAALQRSRLATRSTDARISSAVALPSTASADRNNSSASVASQGEPANKLCRVDRSFVSVWPGPGPTPLQNIASEGSGAADNVTSSSSGAPSGAGLSTAAATLPLSEPCPDTRSLRPSSVHSNGPSSMRSTWSGAASSSSAPPSHHPVTMPASRCSNCDRLGCSPADPQCPFYKRARGVHGDAGWGDSVPHMTQMEWRLLSDGSVEIGGTQWNRGRALGDGNNCLIDTLRQACGNLAVSTSRVRSRLQQLFSEAEVARLGLPHGAVVTAGNYLELQP